MIAISMESERKSDSLRAFVLDLLIYPLSAWIYVLILTLVTVVAVFSDGIADFERIFNIPIWAMVVILIVAWWIVLIHGLSRWKEEKRQNLKVDDRIFDDQN